MNSKNIYNLTNFKGKYIENYIIPNWMGVKQIAKFCIMPFHKDDVINFLENNNVNPIILGNASNVLIKNEIDLLISTKKMKNIFEENNFVFCDAGALSKNISIFCMEKELSGAEFLYTIPGTVGGTILSNAGCYGYEISDIINHIECIGLDGKIYFLKKFNWQYRNSNIKDKCVFTSVILKLKRGNKNIIREKMNQFLNKRNKTQPIMLKTCGSTFKNGKNYSAWKIIEQCGLKGYSIGGAMFSKKHSNFIINYNNATSKDIYNLIELAKKLALEKFNIKLEQEIVYV